MVHSNIDTLVLKANSFIRKGKNEEAINLYNSYLFKFPNNIRAKEGLKKIGVIMTPYFEQRLNMLLKEKKIAKFAVFTSVESWGDRAEYARNGLDCELFEQNLETHSLEIQTL